MAGADCGSSESWSSGPKFVKMASALRSHRGPSTLTEWGVLKTSRLSTPSYYGIETVSSRSYYVIETVSSLSRYSTGASYFHHAAWGTGDDSQRRSSFPQPPA